MPLSVRLAEFLPLLFRLATIFVGGRPRYNFGRGGVNNVSVFLIVRVFRLYLYLLPVFFSNIFY